MTGPVQFLIAAALYHPAAPYLAVILLLGLAFFGFIAFDIRGRKPVQPNFPPTHAKRAIADPAPPMPPAGEHLSQAVIDRVPVLDPARASLLERLEDVVECLGQAQRVLPDVALARILCIRPDPDGSDLAGGSVQPLKGAELDFGVFSYRGEIDLAVMVRPQAGGTIDPERHLIAVALKKAGVPLIRVSENVTPRALRARIQSALPPLPGQARAA